MRFDPSQETLRIDIHLHLHRAALLRPLAIIQFRAFLLDKALHVVAARAMHQQPEPVAAADQGERGFGGPSTMMPARCRGRGAQAPRMGFSASGRVAAETITEASRPNGGSTAILRSSVSRS
jgi:hypothetical protein